MRNRYLYITCVNRYTFNFMDSINISMDSLPWNFPDCKNELCCSCLRIVLDCSSSDSYLTIL